MVFLSRSNQIPVLKAKVNFPLCLIKHNAIVTVRLKRLVTNYDV
jgi:hypothetical protein